MSTLKNIENKATKKTPKQIRRELEARVAKFKARPIEPEIAKSVELRESVADHVFEIMQAQGITQADLARRLGKSRAHVCKILGGANLTLDSLASLSVALGCEIDLQFGNGKPIATNTKLSNWKNIKRPGLEFIQGGLPSQSPWRKMTPNFEEQDRFISISAQPNNLPTADVKITGEELELAA